jgi:hypothetical protein
MKDSINVWRRAISGLVFMVLVGSALAAAGFAQTNGGTGKSSDKKKAASAAIGGTDILVRVAEVREQLVTAEEDVLISEEYKSVSVQIVIENSGTEDWDIRPSNFIVKDANGYLYDIEGSVFTTKISEPTLKSGVVDGGDLVRGWLTFRVGKDIDLKNFKIRYEESAAYAETTVKSDWINLSAAVK